MILVVISDQHRREEMFLRKEKEKPEQIQVVIKEGNRSDILCMGIPEGIAFVSRLLQLGAFKVEVTRSPKFMHYLFNLKNGIWIHSGF